MTIQVMAISQCDFKEHDSMTQKLNSQHFNQLCHLVCLRLLIYQLCIWIAWLQLAGVSHGNIFIETLTQICT